MKKRIILFLLAVLLIIPLCVGCSGNSDEVRESEVADETVFTPPEQDGTLAGDWSAEGEELKINRFFYGDGKLISIIQNTEDETWCIMSLWEETDKKITAENKELYVYDTASGEWKEGDAASQQINSAEQTGDDTFKANEVMPNGITADFEYKRGAFDLEIPDEVSINGKINAFLIH